ncbi:MAG: flagellin [Methanoregula sp.]|nr:flagellin [Methanoregula sp.]
MERRLLAEDGSTAATVALLILVILLSLVMYTAFIATGYASGITARAGMARATDQLVLNGDMTGYADLSGTIGPARVSNPRPSPEQLGAVLVPIRLASVRLMWEQGTGARLGNATVTFTSPAGTETLTGSSGPVLVKPAWAIVQKGSLLPGQTDNGNELLEPDEVFVLFVYPSHSLPPKTPFTVQVRIPDQNPFTVSRRVPDPVTAEMDLG